MTTFRTRSSVAWVISSPPASRLTVAPLTSGRREGGPRLAEEQDGRRADAVDLPLDERLDDAGPVPERQLVAAARVGQQAGAGLVLQLLAGRSAAEAEPVGDLGGVGQSLGVDADAVAVVEPGGDPFQGQGIPQATRPRRRRRTGRPGARRRGSPSPSRASEAEAASAARPTIAATRTAAGPGVPSRRASRRARADRRSRPTSGSGRRRRPRDPRSASPLRPHAAGPALATSPAPGPRRPSSSLNGRVIGQRAFSVNREGGTAEGCGGSPASGPDGRVISSHLTRVESVGLIRCFGEVARRYCRNSFLGKCLHGGMPGPGPWMLTRCQRVIYVGIRPTTLESRKSLRRFLEESAPTL